MNEQHVVIVGGGFAGLNAAKALKKAPVQVTVIDKRNFHLFQPLLYQVATGGLSPADISTPLRGLLRKQKGAHVILGEVESVEVGDREVVLSDGERIAYDSLVLAPGSSHSYFGNEHWAEAAPGLKTVEDATDIRRRIMFAFEAAERVDDPEERRAWLTFVIVGGGPTGVELAGAIGELAYKTLRENFRSFDPAEARIVLLEGGDRILSTFPEKLSEKAVKSLASLGIEVKTGTRAANVTDHLIEVEVDGHRWSIPTRTVIWAAGVKASELGMRVAEATGAETTRPGQVVVGPDLSIPGHPEIFVAGDLASYEDQTGAPLRGTADVAIAEGKYIGKAIRRRLAGKPAKSFKFFDLGSLAVIGRSAAVANLRFGKFSGRLAWWTWLFIHILKLVDFQNRLTVAVQWGWSFFTRNQSARLITGPFESPVGTDVDQRSPVNVETN
jgi:NADH dehydrogenase